MPGGNKNITVRLKADASQFNASIKAAGANAQQLANGMSDSGKRSALLTTGLAAAGMAATAFGAAAINTFRDFDASMSGVQAATGATINEMSMLRDAAIDAGANTIYSANEAARAQIELGKAGLSTANILSGGLSGALNLAASDGMQVASAAELMASTLAQFNLTGNDATKVADALAAGAGNAQGSAQDLGMGLSQVGMVANSFKIGMQETVGTLSAFANAGMIGSDAGTSLKTMLISLAHPSKQAQQTLDSLGIAAYDSQGKFIGLAGLAGQLQEKMSGLTDSQRQAAMATIFGTDAIRAAQVLYEQGASGIDEWTKKVSEQGYAAKMAAARNNNLNGDLENLSGSFETLMLKVGAGANGPLRSIVQTLDMLVDGFSELPAPLQQTIITTVALAGASAALNKALGPVSANMSPLAQSMRMVIDPAMRLQTAFPQLVTGFNMIGQAALAAGRDVATGSITLGKGATAMSGLKSVGSGVVSLLGGPWGIALSAAAGAVMYFANQAAQAKQRTESFKMALESTGDVTNSLIDDMQARSVGLDFPLVSQYDKWALGVEDFSDLLKQTGISLDTFAKAAKGDTPALKEVNGAISELKSNFFNVRNNGRANELQKALDEYSKSVQKAKEQTELKKQAMSDVSGSENQAAGAISNTTSAVSSQSDELEKAAEAIKDYIDGLFAVPGSALSADQAVTRLADVIRETTDTISKNGQTLDANTEAGNRNLTALQQLANQAQTTASKILEHGQALYESTGSEQALTDAIAQANDQLGVARDAFVKAAVAAGMDSVQAGQLADKYGLVRGKADEVANAVRNIPDNKNITVTADTSQAIRAINDINGKRIADKFFTIHGKTYTDDSGGYYSSTGYIPKGATGRVPYATGGLIQGLAVGGQPYSGYVSGWGGKKSDNQIIAASPGEFMQQAEAVDYYGINRMKALNSRSIPKEWLDGPLIVAPQQGGKTVNLNMPVKIVRAQQSLSTAATVMLRNATREARML